MNALSWPQALYAEAHFVIPDQGCLPLRKPSVLRQGYGIRSWYCQPLYQVIWLLIVYSQGGDECL